jgi:GxxExxY protein
VAIVARIPRLLGVRVFFLTTEFTEGTEVLLSHVTDQIIGAAICVHKEIGPGLLESAYHSCFGIELTDRNVAYQHEAPVSLSYKGREVPGCFRIDFLVENRVVVELKAVEKLAPIHTAQLMNYQRLSGCRVGLLFNFNVEVLMHGMRRIVL